MSSGASPFEDGAEFLTTGQFDKAVEVFTMIIAVNPSYAIAFANRGIAYAEQGLYGLAVEDYEEAIRLDPELAMAYNNRGINYHRLDQTEASIQDFTEAVRFDPGYVNAMPTGALPTVGLAGTNSPFNPASRSWISTMIRTKTRRSR